MEDYKAPAPKKINHDYSRYMSYSLNSLKGGYIGDYIGDYYRGYLGGY